MIIESPEDCNCGGGQEGCMLQEWGCMSRRGSWWRQDAYQKRRWTLGGSTRDRYARQQRSTWGPEQQHASCGSSHQTQLAWEMNLIRLTSFIHWCWTMVSGKRDVRIWHLNKDARKKKEGKKWKYNSPLTHPLIWTCDQRPVHDMHKRVEAMDRAQGQHCKRKIWDPTCWR